MDKLKIFNKEKKEEEKIIKKRINEQIKDLNYARKIQKSLLPPDEIKINNCQFNAVYLPSRILSGDIYDVKPLNERYIAFYIGDVAGHGISAALLMVFVKLSIQMTTIIEGETIINSPKQVLEDLNRKFLEADFEGNPQLTIFYCVYDVYEKKLFYSSAGHHKSILIKTYKNSIKYFGRYSLPVGWFKKFKAYEEELQLEQGDKIILYTDGLIELPGIFNFTIGTEILKQKLKENYKQPIKKLIKILLPDLKNMNKEQMDDIAILGMEVLK